MGLQVWLPLNKDNNVIPGISSFSKEGSVTFTDDTDGWYKVQDSSHTSSRWGIYYDFDVRPSTTYTLTVYSKSTTGIACSIGIGSFPGAVTWPAVRDTNNTSTEKLTTYTWTTTQNDTRARIYLAMSPGSTIANNCESFTNQGIIPNFLFTNNGTFSNSSGKIGYCYSFNGSNSWILGTFSSARTSAVGSLCCWVKFNSFPASNSWMTIMKVCEQGGFAQTLFGISMQYANQIAVCIKGSGSNIYTHSLSTNVWYHLCATYDGTVVKLYINGNSVLSKSASTSSVTTASKLHIGGSTGNYILNGYMNDVRYYDNVLSAKEVKLLSQGLILHYPLDRNGWGQNNILNNSSGYQGAAGWNGLISVGNENGVPYFIAKRTDTTSTSRTFVGYSASIASPTSSWEIGDKFTISGYYKIPSTETYEVTANMFIRWGASTGTSDTGFSTLSPSSVVKDKWIRFENTYTVPSYDRTQSVSFTLSAFSKGLSTVYWKNVKLEWGDKATPWTPSISDTIYSTMGIGSSIIRDTSGYQNDGEINDPNIQISSDVVKYSTSLKNNQSNNSSVYPLKGNLSLNSIDEITIAFWAKPSVIGYQDSGIFSTSNSSLPSDYQSTVCNHYDGKFACCNVSGTVVNLSVGSQFTLNQWHHYVFKYDGTTVYFYKDGVLKKSAAQSGKLKPISSIFIFYSFAGNSNRTTSGNISDFRVYATALSADDILELYNNKVI